MSLITVPEFILYDALNHSLAFIRNDYNSQSDKTQTFLYRLVNGLGLQKYNLLTEAVNLFVGRKDDPFELKVNLMFNIQQMTPPAIYITIPQESPSVDSLGNGEGYELPIYASDDSTNSPIFTLRHSANYQLIITSNNSNESTLIYHVIKALIISLNAHFNFLGLQNMKISGGDLQAYPLTPPTAFTKAISLNFNYESSSLDINKYPVLTKLIIQSGTPIIE